MSNIATLITEIGIIIGVLIPVVVVIISLINGMKCLLRSEMLRTYYHNKDRGKIRQYELENFVFLYNAYKALKGNSFIDKIHKEVMTWEVLS
jgi:ABC-type lipoprotein release transport system permease subunit